MARRLSSSGTASAAVITTGINTSHQRRTRMRKTVNNSKLPSRFGFQRGVLYRIRHERKSKESGSGRTTRTATAIFRMVVSEKRLVGIQATGGWVQARASGRIER